MKARLLRNQDILQLLLCTGKIKRLTNLEAFDFLMTYDSPIHYNDDGVWDYDVSMEGYSGDTVAVVNDDGILHIENAKEFRNIFENKESNLITASEYAELHGKKSAIIRRLCQNGRIPGAVQKGKTWLIPENSPYPADERVKY